MNWFKKLFSRKEQKEKWEIVMEEMFPEKTIEHYGKAETYNEGSLFRELENKNLTEDDKRKIRAIVWGKIKKMRKNNL